MVHKIPRDDDVANAKGWKEDLAEGADVDYAGVHVETLKGRDWSGIESVFAIVIILDDPGAGDSGPIEQKKTARGAHGRAQRVLMGWRHKSGFRLGIETEALHHVHSLVVDWYQFQPAPRS